jgi:hypothetical protein
MPPVVNHDADRTVGMQTFADKIVGTMPPTKMSAVKDMPTKVSAAGSSPYRRSKGERRAIH